MHTRAHAHAVTAETIRAEKLYYEKPVKRRYSYFVYIARLS